MTLTQMAFFWLIEAQLPNTARALQPDAKLGLIHVAQIL